MRRKLGKAGRLNMRQLYDKQGEIMAGDHRKAHYFKVFRLELNECAECRKPFAEHPKRGKT